MGAYANISRTNQPVYTETLATLYQEWNVIKKNKFGRKQERLIGIDGKMVYNAKRDKILKGANASSVYRAQRDLTSILKVEVLDKGLTIRITWQEDHNTTSDIEYICECEKDCKEIVAKLTYLKKRSDVPPSGRK